MGDVFQERQSAYDAEHWQHHDELSKPRHICLHLGKLLGKLSTYCERADHGIDVDRTTVISEIIPDLIVYAAQLATWAEVESLDAAHVARLRRNAENYR